MRIRALDDPGRVGTVSGEEAAGLTRRVGAGVRDDVVADRAGQAEPLAQRPPAIAGMTMTSLPSGTAVSRPPELRASTSPTYTFT